VVQWHDDCVDPVGDRNGRADCGHRYHLTPQR
jgi:hypothetical protein